ncbi:hypothetical protein [Sphingomonas sp. SUN039]|uniref:hypothetical protein n=1 Tax=Sphingomonas sp. SUN039 TaxID=2937787 RepID=UPI00216452EB|nr:hypothetical protein [Sphingomonas sp. SUN039]UVO52960.1 hypothetical protein M0209_02055 [Sphingomonas sp. SUN039]
MAKRGVKWSILLLVLCQCSPGPKKIQPRYVFDDKNGSYDHCEFSGTINGKSVYDKEPQPYFSVGGHGFEKKINGLWYPNVYQWRGKDGRKITFVVRDGTGAFGQWGYWYGTLNGERAGGFTVVPRYHWVFNTWDGGTQFECDNPGGDD